MSYNPGPMMPYGQGPIFVQDTRKTSGMAVASMVLSILGLVAGCCSFGVFSIIAVILGHFALRETRDGSIKGHGMAIAGLVMGYVFVVPMALLSFWMIVGGGISAVSDTSSSSY